MVNGAQIYFAGYSSQSVTQQGALSFVTGNCQRISSISTTSSNGYTGFSVNANSSNAVYTDSGKVYPLSLALNFIIKA